MDEYLVKIRAKSNKMIVRNKIRQLQKRNMDTFEKYFVLLAFIPIRNFFFKGHLFKDEDKVQGRRKA